MSDPSADRLARWRRTFGTVKGRSRPVDPRLVAVGVPAELGAGRYRDGFFDLFTGALDDLWPAVATWTFLVPRPRGEVVVAGRNAHGFVLLLVSDPELPPRFVLVDPVRVQWRDDLVASPDRLVDDWLLGPGSADFRDDRVFRAWRRADGGCILQNEVLGALRPLPLGGTLEVENFQEEDFDDWYRSMGRVLARTAALAGLPDRARG